MVDLAALRGGEYEDEGGLGVLELRSEGGEEAWDKVEEIPEEEGGPGPS